MKPRYLLLLKILGYSLILFALWHQLLHWYTALLGQAMTLGNSSYHVPRNIEPFLYGSSMTIIAFVALILSDPVMHIGKKATIIVSGMAAFFLTDLLFIQYAIFPQGQPPLNEDSPTYELYVCIKWLLPFVLWIVPSYPYFDQLLRTTGQETAVVHACPLCRESQDDVIAHLRTVHGKQSLQRTKVRQFISEHSELSLSVNQQNVATE